MATTTKTSVDPYDLAFNEPEKALKLLRAIQEGVKEYGNLTTYTTSKGQEVQSGLDNYQAALVLVAANGGEKPSESFHRDLVGRVLDENTDLSVRQEPWLQLFAISDLQKTAPKSDRNRGTGDYVRIIEMMDNASENKQYPKFILPEFNLRFHRTGGGKEPGSVVITSDASYNQNTFYGRIRRDGSMTLRSINSTHPYNGDVPSEVKTRRDEIVWVARKLNQDPEEFAADHGHQSGNCMFCGKQLTDERSTSVGYGPVCADNHGLEWGN